MDPTTQDQLIAGYISLVCLVSLFIMAVLFTLGIFDWGFLEIREKMRTDQRRIMLSVMTAKQDFACCECNESFHLFWMQIPVTVRFFLANLWLSLIYALAVTLRKLISYDPKRIKDAQMCNSLAHVGISIYCAAKVCTIGFLCARALIPFDIQDKTQTPLEYGKYITKKFTIAVAAIFAVGYAGTLVYGGYVDDGAVDSFGNCSQSVPDLLDVIVTALDATSSSVLLIFFVIPMAEILSSMRTINKGSFKSPLRKVISENVMMGSAACVFSFLCWLFVTITGASPGSGVSLLSGAFTVLDLVMSSVCQLFAIRGFWKLKDFWADHKVVGRILCCWKEDEEEIRRQAMESIESMKPQRKSPLLSVEMEHSRTASERNALTSTSS
jgi:hypothetical protein